jgi:hypothetical protein
LRFGGLVDAAAHLGLLRCHRTAWQALLILEVLEVDAAQRCG